MKFSNKKKFRYVILACTGPFQTLGQSKKIGARRIVLKGRTLVLVCSDNVNLLRKIIKRLRNCSNKTCNEASNEVDVLRFFVECTAVCDTVYACDCPYGSIEASRNLIVAQLLKKLNVFMGFEGS
jgi:hypothetical protein